MPELTLPSIRRLGARLIRYLPARFALPDIGVIHAFTGIVVYDTGACTQEDRIACWTLARFAELRGVGAHTTYGMGRVRILSPNAEEEPQETSSVDES